MLDEIIKEVTTIRGNDTVTSENILSWVKRIEAERAQAVVMSAITETKEFNKIRVARHAHKDNSRVPAQSSMPLRQTCRYCSSTHPPRQCLVYERLCAGCRKMYHFQKVCRSRKTRALNEVEQETIQDITDKDIELMSINSVQFNQNCSILTANIKTSASQNSVIVLYKIDTDSNENIMPEHIFKKVFPEVMKEQLATTKCKHKILKSYNKTLISQLGMYTVLIEHKNIKKR